MVYTCSCFLRSKVERSWGRWHIFRSIDFGIFISKEIHFVEIIGGADFEMCGLRT